MRAFAQRWWNARKVVGAAFLWTFSWGSVAEALGWGLLGVAVGVGSFMAVMWTVEWIVEQALAAIRVPPPKESGAQEGEG